MNIDSWKRPALLALAVTTPVWAMGSDGEGTELIVRLFLVFAVMLVVGKFSGELFERMGQPAVLGELIAGIFLGGSMLGVIPTAAEDQLSEIIKIFPRINMIRIDAT